MAVVNIIHGFHEFLEQQYDVPVKLSGTLNVTTLPLLFDHRCYFPPRNSALLGEVVLITDDKHGHVVHVPAFENLIPQVLYVLEAVLGRDVVHEDVGGSVPQPVPSEVSPLVQRVDREVRDVRTVYDLQFVQMFVYDDGRAEHFFVVGGAVVFDELVHDKLADDRTLPHTGRSEYGKFDGLEIGVNRQMTCSHLGMQASSVGRAVVVILFSPRAASPVFPTTLCPSTARWRGSQCGDGDSWLALARSMDVVMVLIAMIITRVLNERIDWGQQRN